MSLLKRLILYIKIKKLIRQQKKIEKLIELMDTNLKYYDEVVPDCLKFVDFERGIEYCEAHAKDSTIGR